MLDIPSAVSKTQSAECCGFFLNRRAIVSVDPIFIACVKLFLKVAWSTSCKANDGLGVAAEDAVEALATENVSAQHRIRRGAFIGAV